MSLCYFSTEANKIAVMLLFRMVFDAFGTLGASDVSGHFFIAGSDEQHININVWSVGIFCLKRPQKSSSCL